MLAGLDGLKSNSQDGSSDLFAHLFKDYGMHIKKGTPKLDKFTTYSFSTVPFFRCLIIANLSFSHLKLLLRWLLCCSPHSFVVDGFGMGCDQAT